MTGDDTTGERDTGVSFLADLEVISARLCAFPKREFPWRNTSDAYELLVAELLLQRTRPDYVVDAYEAVLFRYPSPKELASASDKDLADLTRQLGFHWRAERIKRVASYVVEHFDSVVPLDYDALRSIPGVGPYTASAIVSLATNAPVAMVDVNTARLMSRLAGVAPRVSKGTSIQRDRRLAALAEAIVGATPKAARQVNLGFLDVGAAYCRPVPKCSSCVLQDLCATGRGQTSDPIAAF